MPAFPRHQDLSRLSPFELKDQLIALAEQGAKRGAAQLLNAGRGNPNWIATAAREAFLHLGGFALDEARRVWNEPGFAGMPRKIGIAGRLDSFLDRRAESDCREWIGRALDYCGKQLGVDPDALVHEFADGIIGDNYPAPGRMLGCCERIVHEYLLHALGVQEPLAGRFDLFATEGATAGICYVFDSLIVNGVLERGDRIALAVPLFTPYIEIPKLERYDFQVVEIAASETREDGSHTWQYPDEEMNKLRDPRIKALFLVNPSNPPSVAMRPSTLEHLVGIVRNERPDLIVITDDVYASFVPGFRSLLSALPYNTICLYSFSKYFGCTGWRLGLVALHENNVVDEKIAHLSENKRAALAKRYGSIALEPGRVKFIDRLLADSRQVALHHTAGLSTPQQVQMALFALAELTDEQNSYRKQTQQMLQRRLKALWDGLGATLVEDPLRAGYYAELDLMAWAAHHYGEEFVHFIREHHTPIDMLFSLARDSSIVLMPGGGFEGPEWSVRVSLANLPEEAYATIGESLREIAAVYVDEWKAAEKTQGGDIVSGSPADAHVNN
jgi:aspartate 4-decarboxylase